jgi:hypothetical protein
LDIGPVSFRWDDVSRLQVSDLQIETGPKGKFMRVHLRGGKTVMHPTFQSERIVAENLENPPMCLVSLTEGYLRFLHPHNGSLQPTCMPNDAMKPHPERVVGYTLALEDLRKTINMAG